MSSPSRLTLSELTEAVAGSAVAIRSIARLLPAGGATDKVFPPTYVKDKQSATRYAMETRKVDGRDVIEAKYSSGYWGKWQNDSAPTSARPH